MVGCRPLSSRPLNHPLPSRPHFVEIVQRAGQGAAARDDPARAAEAQLAAQLREQRLVGLPAARRWGGWGPMLACVNSCLV